MSVKKTIQSRFNILVFPLFVFALLILIPITAHAEKGGQMYEIRQSEETKRSGTNYTVADTAIGVYSYESESKVDTWFIEYENSGKAKFPYIYLISDSPITFSCQYYLNSVDYDGDSGNPIRSYEKFIESYMTNPTKVNFTTTLSVDFGNRHIVTVPIASGLPWNNLDCELNLVTGIYDYYAKCNEFPASTITNFYTNGSADNVEEFIPPPSSQNSVYDSSLGHLVNVRRNRQLIGTLGKIEYSWESTTNTGVILDDTIYLEVIQSGYLHINGIAGLFGKKVYFDEKTVLPKDKYIASNFFTYVEKDFFKSVAEKENTTYQVGYMEVESFRLYKYDASAGQWAYGPWLKYNIKNGINEAQPDGSIDIGYENENGEWIPHDDDPEYGNQIDGSDGSVKENLPGFLEDISDWGSVINSFYKFIYSLFDSIGQVPSMIGYMFPFLPVEAITLIGILFCVILIMSIIRVIRG